MDIILSESAVYVDLMYGVAEGFEVIGYSNLIIQVILMVGYL